METVVRLWSEDMTEGGRMETVVGGNDGRGRMETVARGNDGRGSMETEVGVNDRMRRMELWSEEMRE